MPSFDAGSIEGTLTLDRKPFTDGLRLARQQADDFSKTRITPTISIDTTGSLARLRELETRMQLLNQANVNITANANTTAAMTQLANLQAMATLLNGQTVTINTNTNSSGGLPGSLPGGAGGAAGAGSGAASSGASGGLPGLGSVGGAAIPAALLGLSAFIIPLTGQLLGLVGALSVAGAGLGAFALVAVPAFGKLKDAMTELEQAQADLANATTDEEIVDAMNRIADAQDKLQGPMGEAALAFKGMKDAFTDLQKATEGPVFGVMTAAFNLAADLLPKLEPIITATADGLTQSIGIMSKAFDSPGFQKFLDFVADNIGPVLTTLVTVLMNFGEGFGLMIEKTKPLMDIVLGQLVNISEKFVKFVESPMFDKFVDIAEKSIGPMADALGSIAGALVGIILALSPLQGPVFDFLKVLGEQLQLLVDNGTIELLAEAFGDIVTGLIPLLPIFAKMATELMPAFAEVIEVIAPYLPYIVLGVMAFAAGAALLSAGIGTLIAIIAGGLIVIIILLVKHWDKVADALRAVGRWFDWLWDTIYAGVSGALAAVRDWFMNIGGDILGWLAGAAGWLVGVGGDIIGGLWTGIKWYWDNIIWRFYVDLPLTILGWLTGAGSWLYNTGYGILSGLYNGLIDVWNEYIWPFITGIGSSIGDALSNVADALTWPFKAAFNAIAWAWNNTIGRLSFSIPGWVPEIGGRGWDVPDIPTIALARGGITNGMVTALLGDNRSGKEMVLPFERNNEFADAIAGQIARRGGSGGSQLAASDAPTAADTAAMLGAMMEDALERLSGRMVLALSPDGLQKLGFAVRESNAKTESRRG